MGGASPPHPLPHRGPWLQLSMLMEHVRKKFLTDIKRLILLVLTAVKISQKKLLYAKVNHYIFPRQNNSFFNLFYQMM
jgi:hypothetical protein